MKSCPKCNRTFPDETQKFCTFDGGLLISAQPFDPNATVRDTEIPPPAPPPVDETSRDLEDEYATIIDHSKATMVSSRTTAPTTGQTTTGFEAAPPSVPPQPPASVPPPPPPAPPPPPSVSTPPPAPPPPPAATPVAPPPVEAAPETVVGITPPPIAQAKKKSKLPWIIAALVILLLLGGGAAAGAFFLIIKPWMEQGSIARTNTNVNANTNTNTNSTAENTNTVADSSPSPADSFVAPPGTVQFVNSNDSLDGKLAEHYIDFSFYYPENWEKDETAGVPGAVNFARVERRLPPDFTQESFAVGWYNSSGTFVADLSAFPKRVEQFSAALAKIYPEYEKVSEGPTKVNSMDAYEFRWTGLSRGTEKGDLQLWGRVIFLPTGNEGDTTGATLTMFMTSLATELSSVDDVGVKGETPVILDSFRFKKN